jgi:hypothetical protein
MPPRALKDGLWEIAEDVGGITLSIHNPCQSFPRDVVTAVYPNSDLIPLAGPSVDWRLYTPGQQAFHREFTTVSQTNSKKTKKSDQHGIPRPRIEPVSVKVNA